MVERHLTGARLRQRRSDRGLKQSELAEAVGISPSYLNLIEHNRRNIGGKLLQDLARVLGVAPELLVEGTATSLTAPLREAAAEFRSAGAEVQHTDDLVARYPGWAALIGAQQDRISQLEQKIRVLSDRLTHDPQLATSLHDVISSVTAIRATASILVESDDLDQEWRKRFHTNIANDSLRLSESSQSLYEFLGTSETGETRLSPLEQADAFMHAHAYHFPDLEAGGEISSLLEDVSSPHTRAILEGWLSIYQRDANALPLRAFESAAASQNYDPAALAGELQVGLPQIMRRLAALPKSEGRAQFGLAICDQAGVVMFQKPVDDFALPRATAACPLWPLYQALTQPGRAIRGQVRMPGSGRAVYECAAIAVDTGSVGFNEPGQYTSTMLVRSVSHDAGTQAGRVGPGCRVCSQPNCAARRHPSILSDL